MEILAQLPQWTLPLAFAVVALAGFVKGAVGFAMPMIMLSGLGTLWPPEIALAALMLPTLVANLLQAFRQGLGPALAAVRRYKVLLGVGGAALVTSAQLVRVLPEQVFLLLIGVALVLLAGMQLAGWRPDVRPEARTRIEVAVGLVSGFVGGMSGVWGPPVVAYLTAIGADKRESVRVQGVVYGLGAVALVLAHLRSGVLNGQTLPLSALMLVPAGLGLGLGLRLHDRLDQARFRRATLWVMVLAGLNLVRRGLMG